MTKTEYRKRKVANQYRKDLLACKGIKISVVSAYRETDVIQIIASALVPLSAQQRDKVYRMLQIAIEPEVKTKRGVTR